MPGQNSYWTMRIWTASSPSCYDEGSAPTESVSETASTSADQFAWDQDYITETPPIMMIEPYLGFLDNHRWQFPIITKRLSNCLAILVAQQQAHGLLPVRHWKCFILMGRFQCAANRRGSPRRGRRMVRRCVWRDYHFCYRYVSPHRLHRCRVWKGRQRFYTPK